LDESCGKRLADIERGLKELIADGHSNRESADILGVDEKTIRNDTSAENYAEEDKNSNKYSGVLAAVREIPHPLMPLQRLLGCYGSARGWR
jgi:hypothetical protein